MLHIPIVHAYDVSKQIPSRKKNFHRVENVLKQLVHTSAVRSSRYEARGKFGEHEPPVATNSTDFSCWLLVMIAVERFYAVTCPLQVSPLSCNFKKHSFLGYAFGVQLLPWTSLYRDSWKTLENITISAYEVGCNR